MSTPHPEQALFKAGLYEPAVKACQSVADVPDLMGKVQLLQAAIKYEQDDLMNTKAFIEGCPPEEAETSINHACVMYKEAQQPGAEPAMFEKARLRFQEAISLYLPTSPYISLHLPYISALPRRAAGRTPPGRRAPARPAR